MGFLTKTFNGSGLNGIFEEVSAKPKRLDFSNFCLDIIHQGLHFPAGLLNTVDEICEHPK